MSELDNPIVTPDTVEAPIVENPEAPVPPPEPEVPKEDPEFAKRFAALAKKERDVLAQADRIKADLEHVSDYRRKAELAKTDPIKFIEEHGLKFNDLVDFQLNHGKFTPEQQFAKMQARIDELVSERDQEKQTHKQIEEQKNVDTFKGEQKKYLQGKEEIYELLNKYDASDMVYDIRNAHYVETSKNGGEGEILDVDKVAADVEKYLEDQLEKATSTKKFKSRYASTKDKVEVKEEGTQTKDVPTPSSPSPVKVEKYYLDDDESKERAAKILEDLWKKQ